MSDNELIPYAKHALDAVDLCVLVRDKTGYELTLKRAGRIMDLVWGGDR